MEPVAEVMVGMGYFWANVQRKGKATAEACLGTPAVTG